MTEMSEEQLEEVLQQSSEHLDRARQLTTSMSEENARKKALLDKIRAQRAETLALLTTATTTSEREEDEEDTLHATKKTTAGKLYSYTDLDGRVFVVHDNKDIPRKLEKIICFMRLMPKERRDHLTVNEGTELSMATVTQRIHSHAEFGVFLMSRSATITTEHERVWGSLKLYNHVKNVPVLKDSKLLEALLNGEWQTGEATHVCMKDFHEGAFDSHNRTHLVTTLATIGKVFHVLLGNLWKDFTEIAIDRVNSQDATPLATEFMSWSIETTFRTVFSYLRSSYQQITSDMPESLAETQDVVRLFTIAFDTMDWGFNHQMYFTNIVSPSKRKKDSGLDGGSGGGNGRGKQKEKEKKREQKQKKRSRVSEKHVDEEDRDDTTSSSYLEDTKKRQRKKSKSYCLLYLAGQLNVSSWQRLYVPTLTIYLLLQTIRSQRSLRSPS
jgi:hypothetical protein